MDIEQLIRDNIGLAYTQLHKFNRAYDDDAMSAAMEALWKAAVTFDDTKGIKFSTYASVCIYNAIACYLRPLTNKKQLSVISYDVPLNDENYFLKDILTDGASPETRYVQNDELKIIWEVFNELLDSMQGTSAYATIEYWRSTDFKASQMEIAKATGVSQAYVSRTLGAFRYKFKLRLEKRLC